MKIDNCGLGGLFDVTAPASGLCTFRSTPSLVRIHGREYLAAREVPLLPTKTWWEDSHCTASIELMGPSN